MLRLIPALALPGRIYLILIYSPFNPIIPWLESLLTVHELKGVG
jgi:hypothetical protein